MTVQTADSLRRMAHDASFWYAYHKLGQRTWVVCHGPKLGLTASVLNYVFVVASLSQLKYDTAYSAFFSSFYARQHVVLNGYTGYRNSVCPSVRLSWCLTRPGTDASTVEIQTPVFHRMTA